MKLFGKKKMFAFLLGIVVMIQNAGIVNSNVLAIENNDYNLYSNNDEIRTAAFFKNKCSDTLIKALELNAESYEVIISYDDIETTDENYTYNARLERSENILSDLCVEKEDAFCSDKSASILCVLDYEQLIKAIENELVYSIVLSGELTELNSSPEIYSAPGAALSPSAETRLADMTESVTSIMETDYLKGDINNDGSFDAVDLGTFIKWLSGDSDTELEKIKAADLSDDGNLNVLDLCLMKNELISGQNSDVVPNNDEILCGYYDADYSKPLPSQRVALKTRSFCNPDETLKVDVAMGDSYAHAQKYGNVPAYDTPGHAEYGIYACSDYYNYPKIEDEKLIINGNTGEYLKEYSKEEMNQLDISYKYGEYDSYHHEIAEIDFKKYEAGSTGCIAFYFAWKFDGENPLNLSSQYSGMSQHLYYYVGEKGVSVSDLGIDNAKEDYLSVWGELTNEEIISSAKPLRLICKNENEKEYIHGSVIRKEFELQSNIKSDAYDVTISSCDGVEMVKQPAYVNDELGNSSVVLEFRMCDSYEFGNIRFKVSPSANTNISLKEVEYIEQNIYCYHDSNSDYVSTVCFENLSAYSEKLQNHINNLNRQGECIENDNNSVKASKSPNSITDYSLTVAGYINWTDGAGGVHPAQDIMVAVYTVNGSSRSIVGLINTSSVGAYSCSIPTDGSSKNIMVTVFSQGTNVLIKDTSNSIYSYDSSTVATLGLVKINYTASNTTNVGKSIGIQQAMALANKYIYSLESNYLDDIDVIFPCNSGTYFASGKIYIESEDAFDWDVAQHEYAHYVQNCYNISSSPGGSHVLSGNLADDCNDKSKGIRLAWGEGWATYFAINLQKEMSASTLNIPNVGDTHYQDAGTSIDLNIETPIPRYWKGEANEATVCAVLYDMTDGYNSAEDDNVYFADNNIWDLITGNNCTTLSEFITDFYASGFSFQSKLNLGSTLSRYEVAANPYIPNITDTDTPTFSWAAQGGSINYPNNRFRLVFYDNNYNLILRTSYTTSSSQQLTSYQWTQIRNASSTVYYYVETKQTDDPVTGAYYSVKKELNF